MKAALYDLQGKKKSDIALPGWFDNPIREDLVMRCLEASREFQPHSLSPTAGRRHSASGTISHKRHDWKGQYGRGMSRVPRKVMWRRGVQFNWVGAEVSGMRGGRRPHGHHLLQHVNKMNRKEQEIALHSALAASAHEKYLSKRYSSLSNVEVKLPFVIESSTSVIKAVPFLTALKTMLGPLYDIAISTKSIRAGKGKSRGRKYKNYAGALVIIGADESVKVNGVNVMFAEDVTVHDLYPLGRLVIYTQKALEELK